MTFLFFIVESVVNSHQKKNNKLQMNSKRILWLKIHFEFERRSEQ